MRKLAGFVAAALLGAALVGGIAQGQAQQVTLTLSRETALELQAALEAALKTTTTTAAPTTTLATTTTTAATTTTTTTVATTTTTAPVTTTTLVDPLPPSGENFVIQLRGLDNPDTPQIEPNRFWWDAAYYRSLNSGAHWVDGDRLAYNCAYMFLTDEGGQVVGRVIFARIAYALVNDRFMVEGQRLIDGAFVGSGGQLYHPSFCGALLADEYTFANVPDQRPTVRYVAPLDGWVLEVRDYKSTVTGEGLTFDLVSVSDDDFIITDPDGITHTVYSRVSVIARENGNAVVAVYYDSLSPDVRVTSDLTP